MSRSFGYNHEWATAANRSAAREFVVTEYRKGATMDEIARLMGCTRGLINTLLVEANEPRRPAWPRT